VDFVLPEIANGCIEITADHRRRFGRKLSVFRMVTTSKRNFGKVECILRPGTC
jgi:hypothetical protein